MEPVKTDRILKAAERAFAMDDETWARHANPLSGWTRLPIAPLIVLAIWARVWIGWWCLLPTILLIGWAWINPRTFPPPARADTWMSRAVHGERVLLNAADIPIPTHHAAATRWLTFASVLGLPPLAYGLWVLEVGWVIAGLVHAVGAKLWMLDRMVWLYDDMAKEHPSYRAWSVPAHSP